MNRTNINEYDAEVNRSYWRMFTRAVCRSAVKVAVAEITAALAVYAVMEVMR